MAAGTTYTPLARTTLTSATASVTFSSIPSGYTDLVLISFASNTANNANGEGIRFNNDSATNYSKTYLYGDGTSAVSGRSTNQTNISIGNLPISSTFTFAPVITHIQNYSNATTYKTVLSRSSGANTGNLTILYTGLWRSTAAINRIDIINDSGSFDTGSTFTLYGILAA